jgi:alkyl hydroperoxide reductase subunit F
MLDAELLEQLKSVFSKLTGEVRLRMSHSEHSSQSELEEMVMELASTSPFIKVERMTGSATDAPYLEVRGEGLSESSRIAFRGVPGGHEFSSLVLAILNGDGKGKLPDAGLVERIRSLQGPVRVRTYVSLS